MRKALNVAKYIINKCMIDDLPINNLQLQKLLYYIQVHFLQKEKSAFFDDEIEAWRFGPVVPIVYNQYCGFGSLPIREKYNVENILSEKERKDVDNIICRKRNYQPWDLIKETHAIGKAWNIVYKNGIGNKCVIPKELMISNG